MSTRGIDIRQSTDRIVFRVSLKDSSGDMVATGTTELRVYRVEDDGTLDVYDWTTNDFVAPGSGTPDDETTMTHRQRRDSTDADVNTGIWTVVLSTLTNWTAGQVYIAQVTNTNATPESQEREFQFGGVEGAQTTPGDEMDLVDAPNATAVTAIQNGLSMLTQSDITGGAYALDTDANGRMRIVDGTGTGELDTSSGVVEANIVQLGADAQSLTDLKDFADSGYDPANNRVFADVLAWNGSTTVVGTIEDWADGTGAPIHFANSLGTPAVRMTGGAGGVTLRITGGADVNCISVEPNGSGRSIALGAGDVDGCVYLAGNLEIVGDVSCADLLALTNSLPWNAAYDAEVQSEVADALTAFGASTLTQSQVTGGAYALDTDANGRLRIVDGTGAGELNTNSGAIVQVDQLGTQAKADVNAEVLDVFNVDTHAEPGQGSPGSTVSWGYKLDYMYKQTRNLKTQTSSLFSLYNDAGDTVDQKATVSDDGSVFTFGELATGA